MGMLPARHYESDHTKFIRDVLARKPALADEQKKSRAIWWDKAPRDLEERRVMDQGRVPQKAYSYFSWK
ncbi:MAG: DUF3460 family protein [Burkholderiales bacterium]